MNSVKQILIIEDDVDQSLLISESLEDAMSGIDLTVVQTGGEALELDLSVYDVILLDYNLPDMTGLEILRNISMRDHGPVIMVTGEEVLEIAVESLKEGAEEFITKSIDFHHLLPHIIDRTLSKFHWKQKIQELEIQERERKVQIDTLKRIMMTLAHYLNNAIMPIIFAAELCQRSDYSKKQVNTLVETCLREARRINEIIERFEKYIEEEEFTYTDYLGIKDAMFDVVKPMEEEQ